MREEKSIRNAIVTGASGSIGEAIVKIFAEKGINVWAHARKENKEFKEKMHTLAQTNDVWIKPIYFDLENEYEMESVMRQVIQEKKTIDILINNAGISPRSILSMTQMEELRKCMEINFFSQIKIMQIVTRVMMRQKSGNIVTIGSVSGYEYAEKGGMSYGASKAALLFATRVIARELADYNIRVNSVSPGFIESKMWMDRPQAILEEALSHRVVKRMGKPEEVAKVVYFMTSEDSSYMTGTNVVVEGGGRLTI